MWWKSAILGAVLALLAVTTGACSKLGETVTESQLDCRIPLDQCRQVAEFTLASRPDAGRLPVTKVVVGEIDCRSEAANPDFANAKRCWWVTVHREDSDEFGDDAFVLERADGSHKAIWLQ